MESLRIICAVDDGNIALVPQNDTHFTKGQLVRIIQGRFAGVTGRVARYQGQQRVAVIIEGLIAIATAYIPTAFLEPIDD
jgi:transcription antitermination factor NusG